MFDTNDNENNFSVGTRKVVAAIKSSVDFRANIINEHANNMDKLRNECEKEGFFVTHQAGFPITLPLISILTTSREGDTVLDMYSGTGSTGEAALKLGRKYIGYEIKNEFALSSLVRLKEYHDLNISEMLKAA